LQETILSIKGLSKRYGRIQALDDLSFEVNRGNIFGILGPNGSGKTTTLGIVTSILNKSKGNFTWFGQSPNKSTRKRIGAIIEIPIFYPYLSGYNNLKIVADIKNIEYKDIDRVLEVVGLYERRNSRFRTYSLGMKQRLAIAAALLGNPEVLILDEPTNGLDPQGIAEIRELILKIAKDGITIILASHLLDEVQKICTNVVILKSGKKLFAGKVDEVHGEDASVVIASDNLQELENALKSYKYVKAIHRDGSKIIASLHENINGYEINKYLFDKGIVISHLSLQKKSLEKQFLELLAETK